MGIESDRLVFDYLSRVGDLAQQRQLDSQTRMRLVSSLRGEIDSRRARDDTPAAVRSILGSLGTPDAVVAAATADPGAPPAPAAPPPEAAPEQPAVPEQRGARGPRLRWRKGGRGEEPASAAGAAPDAGSPHLIGLDEDGAQAQGPDWWRVERARFDLSGDGLVPGFRGGVEIPAMLRPPPPQPEPGVDEPEKTAEGEAVAVAGGDAVVAAPLWRRGLGLAGGSVRAGHPVLLAAAALLVAGVVLGQWIVLVAGWGLAYASRRLSRTEAKFAVLGLPAAVLVASAVWLWGRTERRWGDPLAAGSEPLRAALSETWPWTLRAAALTSALYLAWRSRRA
ncbi:hypothetical protein C6N75_24755 [Streptomyces solincola]|uniref:Uncharacterized protein n=1 Tax=Streptomyces solincola TaxID=2100817 RepID=A0A2S9PQH2_9ACTN|nr:hypothetical protein [Streptomyces solincola]PRH76597.1 hypothetical protein C6N75_24755 [Streptomyces solincola]